MPSLCFLGAACALLAASLMSGPIYRWVALVLLCHAVLRARAVPSASALTAAVVLYCAWLVINAEIVTPNYNAESLYRPLILLTAFVAVCAIGPTAVPSLFKAGVALTCALVLLGLAQTLFGFWHVNAQRAAATFATPNTFATALNLFLLPLIALAAAGRASRLAWAVAILLFIGLVSTESRGGYLGFVAGCAFIAVYCGGPQTRAGWRRLGLTMIAAVALTVTVASLYVMLHPATEASAGFGTTVVSRGTSLRPELAAVALGHVMEHPVVGAGASMFPLLYQMSKPASLDNTAHYIYVHNDYLQIWLEFGLIGLALLLAIIALAALAVWRARPSWREDPVPLAAGAGLAAVFAHALIDFPLFVPYLLLVTGGFLAVLAMRAAPSARMERLAGAAKAALAANSRAVAVGVVCLFLAWSVLPVAATMLADHAVKRLQAGDMAGGMYWQSVARRLEPRNHVHYWAEAVMWRELAADARTPGLAQRADELFAKGIAANPYEIINYVERSRLHRIHGSLLEHRATSERLLEWTAEAMRLRPYAPVAAAERVRVLVYAGRADEGRKLARWLLERRPDDPVATRLAAELGIS